MFSDHPGKLHYTPTLARNRKRLGVSTIQSTGHVVQSIHGAGSDSRTGLRGTVGETQRSPRLGTSHDGESDAEDARTAKQSLPERCSAKSCEVGMKREKLLVVLRAEHALAHVILHSGPV